MSSHTGLEGWTDLEWYEKYMTEDKTTTWHTMPEPITTTGIDEMAGVLAQWAQLGSWTPNVVDAWGDGRKVYVNINWTGTSNINGESQEGQTMHLFECDAEGKISDEVMFGGMR